MRIHVSMLVMTALVGGCRDRVAPGEDWLGTPLSARPAVASAVPIPAAPAPPPAPATEERPRPTPMPRGPALPPPPDEITPLLPGDPAIRALIATAESQAASGDIDAALATLRDAARSAPDDAGIPLAEGRISLKAGRHTEAVTAFRRVLGALPAQPDALYGHAYALLRLGRAAEATTAIDKLARLQPGDLRIERLRAAVLDSAGDGDAALAVRAEIAQKEDGATARRELGDALARQGRHADAAEVFAQAAAAAPDDAGLRLRLGTALGLAGRLDAAEATLEASTRLAPSTGAGWQALARVREQRGDAEGAARAWESMLANVAGADATAIRARIERLRAGAADGAGREE